jgi:hypothetical protein
MPYYKEDMI